MDVTDQHIGRRIREVRSWRQLPLSAVAGLAGISPAYLSMIERGLRPVTKRSVLESLASALQVAPTELTGQPYAPKAPSDAQHGDTHAALDALEATLTCWRPGEVPDDGPARPWLELADGLKQLNDHLRPASDYAGQRAVLPDLVHDLLIYAADNEHRRDALTGLIDAYHAIGNVVGRYGARGLSALAGERVQTAAELLEDAELLGLAAWSRAQFIGPAGRKRQYALAVEAAQLPGARAESRGMGHLTAALAAAAQGDADTADDHLREAQVIADRLGVQNSRWGNATMNFGIVNVGIWRVSLGVELGQGAKVAEVAPGLDLSAISPSRQGAYWMGLGCGLMSERKTREKGLAAILKAERLTPQQVWTDVFVREAVSDMLRRAQRDAGGRALRGLAWRMGVAPDRVNPRSL